MNRDWWLRLRERGVIRVAASYAVIAWLLLQIADVTFGPLGVPRWVMVALIVTIALGFPIAVALAWFYEVGDRGIVRDVAAPGAGRPMTHGVRRYADMLIIGVLLVVIAVLVVRQSGIGTKASPTAIAVLPFENLSAVPGGDVIASGIAESVMHQLASLANLAVISRTSSFAFRGRVEDAREIGRQLGARYLLEGSVQSDRERMRVTTHLTDTTTGADVWSMRFDRPTGDIFAIQDEIAVQVTRALELSVDQAAMERMTGQGTTNLEAYLEFLQGRALLATNRVGDGNEAIARFEQSVALDPGFASAYLGIAEAALFVAEYEVTDDRQDRFERARRRGALLVDKALSIDPASGDAYLQRAYFAAFDDLDAAEADYRRGLELRPNSAKGYAGLATVLYEKPARRDEALAMLDRARKLDPLEPAFDVAKAVFLYDERSDFAAARALLDDVVARNPRYAPAHARLCEVDLLIGALADAIRSCEGALALDPLLEEPRRFLIHLYLALGEANVAESLVEYRGDEPSLRALPILLGRHDWRRAGDAAYRALEQQTASPFAVWFACSAIRMHARATGDYARAERVLETESGVSWGADGAAMLPQGGSPVRAASISLADILLESGQQRKGRELLAAIVGRMRHEVDELGRPEEWYYVLHPAALALHGESQAALAMLERAVARKSIVAVTWQLDELEPGFASLRGDPRFRALQAQMHAHLSAQRRELATLRSEGLILDRREPAKVAGQGAANAVAYALSDKPIHLLSQAEVRAGFMH